MIEDELLIEGVRGAADAAGTVGATARMVSDELRMDHGDVVAGLARLEASGALDGDTPWGSTRWYAEAETDAGRARAAEAQWWRETDELLDAIG